MYPPGNKGKPSVRPPVREVRRTRSRGIGSVDDGRSQYRDAQNSDARRPNLWSWHLWLCAIGFVLYKKAFWLSGILQGLMWRAYDGGFLNYSFAEDAENMHPWNIIRTAGLSLAVVGIVLWANRLRLRILYRERG
jgi:cbb3-type cytochrome oxidase subunit 1